MVAETPLLELRNITKTFPGVKALDNVSLAVRTGEVVALIGENGAGKSTLMNIVGGILQPDSGSVMLDGKAANIRNVSDAIDLGIGFIHQELNVLDNLSIAANVFLGREPLCFGPLKIINRRKMHEQTRPHLRRLGLDLPPDTLLSELSIASRQIVEIAKALSLSARLLIMDEPLSALDLQSRMETQQAILSIWRATGVSTLFVSHDIDEAIYLADRVVMLTRRPASVHKVLSVDLPRPRSPHMIEESSFGRLRSSAVAAFREILD